MRYESLNNDIDLQLSDCSSFGRTLKEILIQTFFFFKLNCPDLNVTKLKVLKNTEKSSWCLFLLLPFRCVWVIRI